MVSVEADEEEEAGIAAGIVNESQENNDLIDSFCQVTFSETISLLRSIISSCINKGTALLGSPGCCVMTRRWTRGIFEPCVKPHCRRFVCWLATMSEACAAGSC